MTTDQATIIIRESIREAAKESGCKPSDAHRPTQANKTGLKARNLAIRLARAHGNPRAFPRPCVHLVPRDHPEGTAGGSGGLNTESTYRP